MFLIIFFIKTIIADSALTNSMQSRTLLAFENKQQNLWLNYTLRAVEHSIPSTESKFSNL